MVSSLLEQEKLWDKRKFAITPGISSIIAKNSYSLVTNQESIKYLVVASRLARDRWWETSNLAISTALQHTSSTFSESKFKSVMLTIY